MYKNNTTKQSKIFVMFLTFLILLQLISSILGYRIIGKAYEGSQDMNTIASLRMLIPRIGRSTMEVMTDISASNAINQIAIDISRTETILNGLSEGNQTLRLRPVSNEEQISVLTNIQKDWTEFKNSILYILEYDNTLSTIEKEALITHLNSLANDLILSTDTLIILIQEESKQKLQILTAWLLLGGIISTILILIFWYLILHRGFIKPLSELLPALNAITNGNARQRLSVDGAPSTKKLNTSFNQLATTIENAYTSGSRDLNGLIHLNNRLLALSRELTITAEQINTTLNSPQKELKDIHKGLENIKTSTETMIHQLIEQAKHTENLRTLQSFFEPTLTHQETIDVLITEIGTQREKIQLYTLGYSKLDDINFSRLDNWLEHQGVDLFIDHPRFQSLREHQQQYRQTLANIQLAFNKNQNDEILIELSRADSFAELSIMDLSLLKKTLTEQQTD